VKDYGPGADNPELPHPEPNDPLDASPWEREDVGLNKTRESCKWCHVWKGTDHHEDCPWHVRLMTIKQKMGDSPFPQRSKRLWVIGTDSGIGAHAAVMAGKDGWECTPTTRAVCDVQFPSDITEIAAEKGPFDAVLYCAGVNFLEWTQDIKEEHLMRTFDVNVMGFIRVLRELARTQLSHHTSIVAISSDADRTPMRTSMAYCASKAALSMAVRVAAREHAPYWRVNAIAPAAIEGTEMSKYVDARVPELRGWTRESAADYESANAPLGRRIAMGDVASLALDIIAGPESLNGSIVTLTGGK